MKTLTSIIASEVLRALKRIHNSLSEDTQSALKNNNSLVECCALCIDDLGDAYIKKHAPVLLETLDDLEGRTYSELTSIMYNEE